MHSSSNYFAYNLVLECFFKCKYASTEMRHYLMNSAVLRVDMFGMNSKRGGCFSL